MDARSRTPGGRRNEQELDELLRRMVAQVRSTPTPTDALGRALEGARRINLPTARWRSWLIRGLVGRN